MKLSAIIVAYQPKIDEVFNNILSYIADVDALLIFQNTLVEAELLPRINSQLDEVQRSKVIFLGSGTNVGIASALNGGVQWSLDNNFTHILTLDQDSKFKAGVLPQYKQLIEQFPDADAGVFGINPNNWGNLLYNVNEPYIEVADTITSGSVFPLEVFRKFGLFEDNLFIDAVDYEFCYRLKSFGYRTIVFPKIILEHQVGEYKRTWLGFKTDNYSAFRTYFVVRNQTIIWRRYPKYFSSHYKLVLVKTHIISRIVKVILAEDHKVSKIKAIAVGLIHGLQGRLGFYKA